MQICQCEEIFESPFGLDYESMICLGDDGNDLPERALSKVSFFLLFGKY